MDEDFDEKTTEPRTTMRELLEAGAPIPAMAIPWAPELLALPGRDLNELITIAREKIDSQHDDPDLRLHAISTAISHLSLLPEENRSSFDLIGRAEAIYHFLSGFSE